MFTIIQSNDTDRLADRLTAFYQNETSDIFDEFIVIVPAKVLEEWLKKRIAKTLGISSLFTSQFWGQYQWQLIARVLDADAPYSKSIGRKALKVPETAVLSASVIRWRLFAYLFDETLWQQVFENDNHALYALLLPLMDETGSIDAGELWRFCDGLARLYVSYLTERTDWLDKWANGRAVDVLALIDKKDKISRLYGDDAYLAKMASATTPDDAPELPNVATPNDDTPKPDWQTPEWLKDDYVALERGLRFLWQLFKTVYQERTELEQRFWAVLDDQKHPVFTKKDDLLPKTLYLFTVQQLPQIELDFLTRLSLHTNVVLLHFNPSMMFWADIVDKNWLLTQKVINPERVYLKDYGHSLLSRLGKSSRETFAMLADLSGGGEYGAYQAQWVDIFDETLANTEPKSLLDHLKADILMLGESPIMVGDIKQKSPAQFVFDVSDDSLVIHNCHSLKRELEIARLLIGKWLNEKETRQLSDIAIMLPDVQSNGELIASVFGQGVGMDGLTLPAKITGIMDESTHKLWAGILGFYTLPAGRLYFDEFCEWLMNDYVYQAFGLSFEMARRACELLEQAGFVRGLDETHLKQTLHQQDSDFRRTLAFAIDRLSLSLTMGNAGISDVLYPFDWQGNFAEKTQTLPALNLDDGAIVQALCRIYLAFLGEFGKYTQKDRLVFWLNAIENNVINRYFYEFHNTQNLKSIFNAMNAMKASVRANKSSKTDELKLPLRFVLDALSDAILAQQISAEPSDVITFGRFGSLRSIGFGLVIMLGMNLSEFPRTEPINRLDLKKAGLPRRGDRASEDDDNGAFLEAMLQAKENCWIFFSGQTDDGKKKLPATPVNELINFLKTADWQGKSFADIEPYLIREHTPTPFHQDNFTKDTAVPSPVLWQQVYQRLVQDRQTLEATIELPCDDDVKGFLQRLKTPKPSLGDVSMNKLIGGIKNPAKAYLADKLHMTTLDEKEINEPLGLSKLDNYKLNLIAKTVFDNKNLVNDTFDDELKNNNEIKALLYDTLLPAGVARQQSINEKTQELTHIFAKFYDVLIKLNIQNNKGEMSNVLINLPLEKTTINVTVKLPKETNIWHNLKLQKSTTDKHIECYLWHLCWQIHLANNSIEQDNDDTLKKHSSIWCFYDDNKDIVQTLICKPMTYEMAVNEFKKWLVFYELITQTPICLTPSNAIAYLNLKEKNQDKQTDGQNTTFDAKAFADWTAEPSGDYIKENNSHHPYWQMILGQSQPMTALSVVLPMAQMVYGDFYANTKEMIL